MAGWKEKNVRAVTPDLKVYISGQIFCICI